MPRRIFPLLTLALLAAAFLRLWQLVQFPPGLHYDLATKLLIADDIAFHGYRPIFIEAYTGREALYFYWLALLVKLLGSRVFSLHVAGAFVGLLTVSASYFAVRQVLAHDKARTWVAAGAAILLATSLWHVLLSRLGYRLLTEPLMQALALGFLWRGLHRLSAGRAHILVQPDLNTSPVYLTAEMRRTPSSTGFSPRSQRLGGEFAAVKPAPTDGSRHRVRTQATAASRIRKSRIGADFALAGLFTGLTAYTYLASRAFPIPLAIAILYLSLSRATHSQSRTPNSRLPDPLVSVLGGLAIFALVAVIVFAPLGYYFLTHPDAFFNRMGQVAPRAGDIALLRSSATAAFGMLFVRGDPYLRFNLPDRPIFGPILGLFFLIGLGTTVYRFARPLSLSPHHPSSLSPCHPLNRISEVLLLVWIPAMLLPTILAVHEIFPSNVRAIGLIPLVFVFPARGLVQFIQWFVDLKARLSARHAKAGESDVAATPADQWARVILVLTLALTLLSTSASYFFNWSANPAVYYANDADIAAAVQWLNTQNIADTSVYMSAIHYRHPTAAVLARDYPAIRWYTGGQALAIPEDGPALYLFPRSAPPPSEWLAGWEPAQVTAPDGPDGAPAFHAYRFPSGDSVPLPEFTPAAANFGNIVELLGYRLAPAADTGDEMTVDCLWRVLNPPPVGDYRAVADLVDRWGFHWTQGFNDAYPSEQWRAGEVIVNRLRLPIPTGTPPGDYLLAVTLFAPSTGESLPVLDDEGRFAGAIASFPVKLPRLAANAQLTPPQPQIAVPDLHLGPLRLLGYDRGNTSVRPGEPLALALYWQAMKAPTADYRTRLSLVATDGASTPLTDDNPVHGSFPTSQWGAGEFVTDRYAPRLPRDIPAGNYGLRLDLLDTASGVVGSADLGALDVPAMERDFSPVAPAQALHADLGGFVTLLGYDAQPGAGTLSLTLYWQAQAEMDADYTVFVHLLDSSGQIAAQRDVQPRAGTYPTTLWVKGEIISDRYAFALAPGDYTIETGLYWPQNGKRLGTVRLSPVSVK